MKLLDKIKNALFEDDEEEAEEEQIVKKIDVTKTIAEEKTVEVAPKPAPIKLEEKPKSPIIFEDEDFLSDTKEINFKQVPKKEDKILYGGHELRGIEKPKEKFQPSLIISPVYGVLDKNYTPSEIKTERKSFDHLFVEEQNKPIDFDTVRQKAFGQIDNEEEPSLLYDMSDENEYAPSIEKVTLGDAEEYFEDLGLEYEIDYKDESLGHMTRQKRNKKLQKVVEEEIKDTDEEHDPEEKNLYDLINMMYESKGGNNE